MTCEQFDAIVDDLNRPGALDEATQGLAQFHAQVCDSCRARLERSRSLSAGLRALQESESEEGAPPRTEAMLRSAFLRRQWQIARTRSLRRWTGIGIAAAFLAGAGFASRQAWRAHRPAEIARISAAAQTPAQQSSLPAGQVPAPAAANDDKFLAEFQPYPAGGAMMPFESGQVVRVSLPGSALVAMGFPVDGDRAGDRFTADVLVGDDGLPRAIRFPRQQQ